MRQADGTDPMLPQGTDKCQCSTCKEYFNSTFAFEHHRTGRVGRPERRCLPVMEMQIAGWTQNGKGHWLTPRRGEGRGAHHRERITP